MSVFFSAPWLPSSTEILVKTDLTNPNSMGFFPCYVIYHFYQVPWPPSCSIVRSTPCHNSFALSPHLHMHAVQTETGKLIKFDLQDLITDKHLDRWNSIKAYKIPTSRQNNKTTSHNTAPWHWCCNNMRSSSKPGGCLATVAMTTAPSLIRNRLVVFVDDAYLSTILFSNLFNMRWKMFCIISNL